MVYAMDVNTLNFCQASVYEDSLAVPCTFDSEKIDVYRLDLTKNENRLSRPFAAIDASSKINAKTGIIMSLVLDKDKLAAGYESGHIVVFDLSNGGNAQVVYVDKSHTQPILSMVLYGSTLLSSSADALISKHDVKTRRLVTKLNTKHSGLSCLDVRSDGKLFATAGWDGMVRVFKFDSLKPVAVFRGGRQDGVTCVAFSLIRDEGIDQQSSSLTLGSAALARREKQVSLKHWLAVGGKDGAVALYELY